jgi:hypothetical protein
MAISFHRAASTLITPECDAPGCNVTGDQDTMVRCRRCRGWFCPEHIDVEEGVALIRLTGSAHSSLSYYRGTCASCHQAYERTSGRAHLS